MGAARCSSCTRCRASAITESVGPNHPPSYILATLPSVDDRDHTLVRVLGNEASQHDIGRFTKRFGVDVVDNYGSTEGGITVMRSAD